MPNPRPQRVLVIGGGPCGLVTLRNLLERGRFAEVQLVERRGDVGGVWNVNEGSASISRWPSPLYPGLVGNVLPEFLSFSGLDFETVGDRTRYFPTARETSNYLRKFAEPLRDYIRLNTEITTVEETANGDWEVSWRFWKQDGTYTEGKENWDAVVIATAWYDDPKWPVIQGLESARAAGLAVHAVQWKGPEAYAGKDVLVVGNANSSNDITAQLLSVARSVRRSTRNPASYHFVSLPDERINEVGPITDIVVTSNDTLSLTFSDNTSASGLHAVIFGTGYNVSVSYLRVREPSSGKLAPINSSSVSPTRIPSLHHHILYAYNTTLAFIGSIVSGTPFVLADATSTWLALAWNGILPYPESVEERHLSETARLEELENIKKTTGSTSSLIAYNVLGGAELSYARQIRKEIIEVRPEFDNKLLEWDDAMWARREGMYPIKLELLKQAREKGLGPDNRIFQSS